MGAIGGTVSLHVQQADLLLGLNLVFSFLLSPKGKKNLSNQSGLACEVFPWEKHL